MAARSALNSEKDCACSVWLHCFYHNTTETALLKKKGNVSQMFQCKFQKILVPWFLSKYLKINCAFSQFPPSKISSELLSSYATQTTLVFWADRQIYEVHKIIFSSLIVLAQPSTWLTDWKETCSLAFKCCEIHLLDVQGLNSSERPTPLSSNASGGIPCHLLGSLVGCMHIPGFFGSFLLLPCSRVLSPVMAQVSKPSNILLYFDGNTVRANWLVCPPPLAIYWYPSSPNTSERLGSCKDISLESTMSCVGTNRCTPEAFLVSFPNCDALAIYNIQ